MDANNSMYVFCESKQKSFDDVCCAFANSENMEAIAREIEMKPGMLRNKLNPEQPHVLKPVEMIAISKVSGNYTLINCLLLGLDVVTAPIDTDEDAENVFERLLKHSANAGELSSIALEHKNAMRLSRTHKQKIIKVAQAGIGNLVLLINDIEHRTSGGLQPLLQFGTEFIANAPMPGLT